MKFSMSNTRILGVSAIVACSGLATGGNGGSGQESAIETVRLQGIVRDFRAENVNNGHPDFENRDLPAGLFAHIASDALDEDGDPAFVSSGFRVSAQGLDGQGRPIIDGKGYIAARAGDAAPHMADSPGGSVHSADSFRTWFKDDSLVNLPARFDLEMQVQNNRLVFDGDLRTQFASMQGFGGNKVFGYTFELETLFRQGTETNLLTFGADDCLWVYVDGKLVVDLGGSHEYMEQTIDLSRLSWLAPGRQYTLKIFYAERMKQGSRLRIESGSALQSVSQPLVSAMWD